MADEPIVPGVAAPEPAAPGIPAIETPTIIAGATPEPIVTESAAGPAVVVEPSAAEPAAEEKPAAESAPATEPAATEKTDEPVKPPSHTDTPTLLEEAGKPTAEAKPVPEGEKKPGEAEKPLEPVETRTYEPFTLPEGVTPDEQQLDAFRQVAASHNLDQTAAQGFLDLHVAAIQRAGEAMRAEQQRIFAETRKGWVEEIKADPILGGAGHQTALMAAARMRDLLVPEAHRAEFADFMRVTGAGDHPALMRLFHTAARFYDEPAAPPMPARPVPDRGGNGAKQPRSSVMYDHPSSRRAAGRG